MVRADLVGYEAAVLLTDGYGTVKAVEVSGVVAILQPERDMVSVDFVVWTEAFGDAAVLQSGCGMVKAVGMSQTEVLDMVAVLQPARDTVKAVSLY